MPSKTGKGDEEEQNTWHDTQKSALAVADHQIKVAGIIQMKPNEHNEACQRHYGKKAGQSGLPAPDLCAEDNNAETDK